MTATTADPPLWQARLQGDWSIDITYRSAYGWTDSSGIVAGAHETRTFNFQPTCASGPCDVTMRFKYFTSAPVGRLEWTGPPRYEGRLTEGAYALCDDAPKISDYQDLMVRITEAEMRGGVWRATRIEGTYTQYSPPGLGCGGSQFVATLTGLPT